MCSNTSMYIIVSNCWSVSDATVPHTVSYARRGCIAARVLTSWSWSTGSGSKHTHLVSPRPESRNRVFDPSPAPTSSISPLRNGRICLDQYAFQLRAAANKSNSEPTYLNSFMRIDVYRFFHKQGAIPEGNKPQVRPIGEHKDYEDRRVRDHLDRDDSKAAGRVGCPPWYGAVCQKPDHRDDNYS